jgi:cytochrome c-type biogenesis protein CcmH
MKNKSMPSLIIFIFFLFVHQTGLASIDVYEFENERQRADFVSLTKELRCPKCQNQDIADSNAPIAADMRKEVHRLLGEGKDKESIVNYMIDRFGEFVTYKPKKSLETFMLWYGPWILILIGIFIIFSILKMNKKGNDIQERSSEDVRKILDQYDHDK